MYSLDHRARQGRFAPRDGLPGRRSPLGGYHEVWSLTVESRGREWSLLVCVRNLTDCLKNSDTKTAVLLMGRAERQRSTRSHRSDGRACVGRDGV